jgi:hypothetical protein
MKLCKFILIVSFILGVTACKDGQSLQEYLVENQGNKEFVSIDVPASMFARAESLNAEQRKTLESIKKINVLAIPKKAENVTKIEAEKSKVAKILEDEKYQLLMKYGGGESRVEIYFTGDEEAVDEIILYGFDDQKGMGIARLLGENMNPGDIMNLMQSMQKGDLDLEGLSAITGMFVEKVE